jgi:hypothetical protein
MSQRVNIQCVKWRNSSRDHEAVQQHGNRTMTSFDDGARNCHEFCTTNVSETFNGVVNVGNSQQCRLHYNLFTDKAFIVNPGPAPNPFLGAASTDGRARCGSRRRVADPHFAKHQQVHPVDTVGHSRTTGAKRLRKSLGRQRRFNPKVAGRPANTDINDLDLGTGNACERVDRTSSGRKYLDHFCGQVRRIRADSIGSHAVISREYQTKWTLDNGLSPVLPTGQPNSKFVEHGQGTRRPKNLRGPQANVFCRSSIKTGNANQTSADQRAR